MSSAKVTKMYPEFASSSVNYTQKNSLIISDSMITGDRSRAGMGTISMISNSVVKMDTPLVMAGPMREWDFLYLFCVLLSLINTMVGAVAVVLPNWFTHRVKNAKKETMFGLFDSTKCSKDKTHDCDLMVACYDGCYLGIWVLVVQIMAVVGLTFCALSLFVQGVNLCLKLRRRVLHMLGLYFMAFSALMLMLAGHIAHNHSVWRDVNTWNDSYLRINPLGSGLMHVCTVLGSWICVMAHVSSHGPGPLSTDTRFAHTYDADTKPPPVAAMLRPEELLPEPAPQTQMLEDFRKASIHSTAV